MSLLGIDIGTSYCVLATIQRGAVTIVRNELSERLTPALIGYTDKERLIGEPAHTQMKSNYRNTCRNIKQLLGVTPSNSADLETERHFALAPLGFADDSEGSLAGFEVTYKGKEQIFTATRCLAALLTKLKDTAEKSIGSPVKDVVISVPAWYSDRARQAVLDAADIAHLNCLRAMNEHAAVALDYGIYRTNTFDSDKASRVVFVGVGHGSTNVSVVDFTRGQLRVLGVATDKTLGGRDIDFLIARHFAEQFQKKYGVDPLKNPKAVLKLEDAATRMKKILSANSEATINIECLMDDYDISGILKREEFEALCIPFKQKLLNVLNNVFVNHNLNPDDVHHIEIVGGCTRTPWIQETILAFFKHRLPLSKTLNMDETVARGCALQAAMLDPRYRVREFNVVDCLFDPVSVSYLSTSGPQPELKTSILFEKGSTLGMKKWLTFNRSSNFEIRLSPEPTDYPLISQIELPTDESVTNTEYPKRVKVGAKLTLHGTVAWEAAQFLIDEEVEEMVKEKRLIDKPPQSETASGSPDVEQHEQSMANGAANEGRSTVTSASASSEAAPTEPQYEEVMVPKKKVKTRRLDCRIISSPRPGYLEPTVKTKLCSIEIEMIKDDMNQRLIKEMMNDLETYIYKMQSLLSNGLRDFASDEELQQALLSLASAHDWVYDTIDGTKECYQEKMKELQALCDPIVFRHDEFIKRKEAIEEALQVIADLRACETSPEWAHVEPGRMLSLINKITEASRWLDHVAASLQTQPTWQNPTTTSATIRQEKDMLINFSKTILIPKPEVVPTAAVDQNETTKPSGESGAKDGMGSASTQDTQNSRDVNMSSPEPGSGGATESNDIPMS